MIKINGVPIALYGSPILRPKLYEPLLLLASFTSSTTSLSSPLSRMDIRLRVSGGGHTSQMYALRQAVAKAVVAYVAKYEDAASALEVRKVLVAYDRTLLVADPRRCEPKKFGGNGARLVLSLVVCAATCAEYSVADLVSKSLTVKASYSLSVWRELLCGGNCQSYLYISSSSPAARRIPDFDRR